MGITDKIANAKNTYWVTEGIPNHEVREIVTDAKEAARKTKAAADSAITKQNSCMQFPIAAK